MSNKQTSDWKFYVITGQKERYNLLPEIVLSSGSESFGMAQHTDTQTNTQTWRIVDGIRREGQFGENNCLNVSFP